MLSSDTSEEEISKKRRKRKVSQRKNKNKNKKDNINNKLDQQNTNIKIQKQSSQKEIDTKASTSEPMETAHSHKLSKVQKKSIKKRSQYESSLHNFTIKLRSNEKLESTCKMAQRNIKIKPVSIRLQKMKNNHTSTPIPTRQNHSPFEELPELDISDIIDKENIE